MAALDFDLCSNRVDAVYPLVIDLAEDPCFGSEIALSFVMLSKSSMTTGKLTIDFALPPVNFLSRSSAQFKLLPRVIIVDLGKFAFASSSRITHTLVVDRNLTMHFYSRARMKYNNKGFQDY
jgi:hypothetical protein